MIICCIFHEAPFEENVELLNQRISVLNFLLPPKIEKDADYRSHIARSKGSFMGWVIEESNKKKTVIDKNVFVNGSQDAYTDAVTALDNLVTLLEIIANDLDHPEPPLIVKNIQELDKLLNSRRFAKFADKMEDTTPWFTHALV